MTQDPRREELAAHDERGTRDGETVEVAPTHGPEHDTEVHPHVSKSGERVVLNTIAGEVGTEAVRAQAAALLRVVGEAGGLTQDELTERVHEAMAATGAGDQPTVVARSVARSGDNGTMANAGGAGATAGTVGSAVAGGAVPAGASAIACTAAGVSATGGALS